MKKNIKLTESQLNKFIVETCKKILNEDMAYMSDEDIANQYRDMKITYFEINPLRYSEGWSGTFELEFPNADDIDYDSTMVNDFFVYDSEGNRIAWDYWMPDEQTNYLNDIIRKEIAKRSVKESITKSDLKSIVEESVNRILSEAQLNELDPRTYASLAGKRAAQGQDDKAAKARQAARNAWNKQYGYGYDNGKDGYGYMKMGGSNQFTHNAGSNYGISAKHGNMSSTQNYAYNPQKGTEWHGNGRGDSYTQQHIYDPGDNGAHRVADEMENGNGVYQNGRWQ